MRVSPCSPPRTSARRPSLSSPLFPRRAASTSSGGVDLLTAAAVLRRCALFVGNDTGLMHIAAAAGAPTLGLFGPSHASHYGPWGRLGAIASTFIPAAELFRRGFDHRTTGTLMDSLSVEAAAAAARRLLERAAGAAA